MLTGKGGGGQPATIKRGQKLGASAGRGALPTVTRKTIRALHGPSVYHTRPPRNRGSQPNRLLCFNQFGDVERSLLREGNVHSAKDWRAVLEPVVARYQGRNLPRYFRAAAAFANPELYEYLEAEGFEYAVRLPGNDALLRDIEPLLTRPVGRPSNALVVWYAGFLYQAKSWGRARRVVAKWSGTMVNYSLASDSS